MPSVFRLAQTSLLALSAGLSLAIAPPVAAAPAPAATASVPAVQRPMNVLLIMSDDLGARFGGYGFPEVKTPNLDRLAREGVLFERAYTQFPQCAQSRSSFLTGRRPNATRVFDLKTDFRAALPDVVTLPQYFRQQGYYAGRVGKIFHQGVPTHIGTSGPDDAPSWTEVVNPRGRDKDAEIAGRLKNLTPGIPYGAAWAYLDDEGKDAEQTDGKIADETVKMLERAKDGPFFIAAGFYRPHVPDVAPKAYFDLYPPEKIRIEDAPPEHAAVRPLVTSNMWPANYDAPEAERRRMMQAYYASTTFMDAQVGLVLDALDRLGLKDNTIVIFMSDHGYMLGEHGQWQKNALWESSLRTPLIIRSPGAQGNGAASPKPVELLDIYPTLVELAGLPAKGGLEGVSLTPLLAAPRKAAWDRPAYSQVQGGRSVRTDRWRYTEWEGGRLGASLYDMVADPRELRNLAGEPEYAPIVRKLQALLPNETVEPRGPAMILYDRAAGLAKFETYADALAKDEGKK